MKVTAEGLRALVSKMVREEVKKVLPQLVAEHVSEMYLRRVVSEVAQRVVAPAQAAPQRAVAPKAAPRTSNKVAKGYRPGASLAEHLGVDLDEGADWDDDSTPAPVQTRSAMAEMVARNNGVPAAAAKTVLAENNPLKDLYSDVELNEEVEDIPLDSVGIDLSHMRAMSKQLLGG